MTLILTVCKLAEGGRPKCHKYWPDGSSDTDPDFQGLVGDDIRVKVLGTVQLGESLEGREFEVTMSGKKHRVKQLHYVGWPDHGVPTGASIEDFTLMLHEFIDMLLNSDSKEKAVIHCSAGIGRTGTTAALAHLMISICS